MSDYTGRVWRRDQAAARLGISVVWLDKLVSQRRIESFTVGRARFVREEAVQQFIRAAEAAR